jgi:acetyltransferase-like isoleucine patch superfamily enzyme
MQNKQIWEETDDIEIKRTLDEIRRLYTDLNSRMKEKWNRYVPLEELIFDRWEKAKQLGCGEGTSIYRNSYIFGDVKIGSNTWIGPFTVLDGSGGLQIGDNCNISAGVQIYSHDTVKRAVSGGSAPLEKAPVYIGNCCYIGPQSVVSKGITIGDHSIVGACSFVNRTIPPNSIVAGVNKIIGSVIIEGETVSMRYETDKK